MDDLVKLVYTTIMVSASGALSPGPLTIVTIALGSRYGWRGGLMVAMGHTIVELPYIIMLYFFFSLAKSMLEGFVGNIITIAGSGMVMFFAFLTIRDGLRYLRRSLAKIDPPYEVVGNPVLVGILFTGLNVWFLIWWLSIGLELISLTTGIGFSALLLLFASHIWLDYLWLWLVAEAGKKGTQLVGAKGYSILMLVLGIFLSLFAVNIVLKRFTHITILP